MESYMQVLVYCKDEAGWEWKRFKCADFEITENNALLLIDYLQRQVNSAAGGTDPFAAVANTVSLSTAVFADGFWGRVLVVTEDPPSDE